MSFYDKFAYEASAGSGKTFALVSRYVSLLFMGAKPSSILTLTFTNKAANEMSSRILTVLKELHLEKREAELNEISKITDKSPKEILDTKDEVLRAFLTSDIKISTIDKFFSNILRKFSLYEGIMPDFEIDESVDESRFIKRFIATLKSSQNYKKAVEFASFEDRKLNSMFEFLENLYSKDSELENLPAKTDENHFELEQLVLKCAKELQELFFECEKLSNTARKSLLFGDIEELYKKSWIERESLDYRTFAKCYTPKADEIFFRLKELLSRYFRAKESYFIREYLEIYRIYKESKKELTYSTNSLRFNDVSYYVNRLLNGRVDSDFLYFRLDSQISHLLIDEFQDTNILQYKVLKPIIDEITSGEGVESFRSFFYVGDVKQSIYRFRGGAKELFGFLAKHYGVFVDKLETNYRSKKEVVEFVNRTFEPLITSYTPQLYNDKSNSGYVKVTEGEEVLTLVSDEVFALLEMGVDADDIAILTFSNSDASAVEERLLSVDSSLHITTESSMKLRNDRYVSAVIEFLKYLYFMDELYLLNFKVAIGMEYDEEVETSDFSVDMELHELIKKIIKQFKLYKRDENLSKLITLSLGYRDIESFLFESDRLSAELPAKKGMGIKILTIHKSKGLEFEHLLVMDRLKKKSSDRSSMIFYYEDIELKDLYIKFKNREFVDSGYARAKEREAQLSREDEINLLYVAFTRAKSSLIICQKECKSSFEIVDLKPLEIGKVTIEQRKKAKEPVKPFEYKSIKVGLQNVKDPVDDEPNDIASINFGIALHYMLEMMDKFDIDSVERAYWAMKNRHEFKLKEGESEEIRARVEKLLEDEEFLSLVDGKLYKEQPIFYSGEVRQLDLLVDRGDDMVIIDYKSSDSVRNSHLKQVLGYKEAIKSITDKEVLAYLCYVRDGEVELVEV